MLCSLLFSLEILDGDDDDDGGGDDEINDNDNGGDDDGDGDEDEDDNNGSELFSIITVSSLTVIGLAGRAVFVFVSDIV